MAGCPVHGSLVQVGCGYCEPERRKQAFADWVAHMRPWDLTITLTFDPKRRRARPPGPQRGSSPLSSCISPRVTEGGVRLSDVALSGDVALRRVKTWLGDARQALDRPLAGVVCMELHKSGEPHFHGLVGIDGGLRKGDVIELSSLWYQRNGYNRLEIPESVRDVAVYASKYMLKDMKDGGVLFWPEKGTLGIREGKRRLL